jgi:hypothetical protein
MLDRHNFITVGPVVSVHEKAVTTIDVFAAGKPRFSQGKQFLQKRKPVF